MSNCITIYTDASVCSETKTGGWACWIKSSPGETALFSGAFKMPVAESGDAELRAIANALFAANKTFSPKDKIIVVVTDCAHAIKYIEYARTRSTHKPGFKRKGINEGHFRLAKMVLDEIPAGCELRVNKVKAHSSKDGKRSYVNSVVDKESRAAMRKARASKGSKAA